MSYYGDRYERDRYDYDRTGTRGRAVDVVDYVSHKPVTKKVEAGRRARIAVETGGDDSRYQQQQELEKTIAREEYATLLAESRRRRGGKDRYEKPPLPTQRLRRAETFGGRRNSFSRRNSRASPVGRFQRPGSDAPFGEGIAADDWSPPEDSEEEDSDFDFSLPKPTAGVKEAESIAFEIHSQDGDDAGQEPVQTGKAHFSGPMVELSISRSRWLGDSTERGEIRGEIVTIHNTGSISHKGTTEGIDKVHKWYHLERSMMNFEDFMAASLSVLQLPEKQQRNVSKLLRDVQKRFEKQRHHGRDMEPDCIGDFFLDNASDRSKPAGSVVFLTFPYFSLDPYSQAPINALPPGSPLHPLRPILQAHYYATGSKRELAQVITHAPDTAKGECLHLSQIFCLIVNGETMITSSRLPLDILRGDTIHQTLAVAPSQRVEIKVSSFGNRSWRIPVSRRVSWPAFLALFQDLDEETEQRGTTFQFKDYRGIIDGARWPEVIDEAFSGSLVELQVMYRSLDARGFDTQEPEELTESSVDGDASADADTLAQLEDGPLLTSIDREPPPTLGIKPTPTFVLEKSNTLQIFKHAGSSTYMRGLANNFQTVLRSNPRATEKNAYKKCPGAKAADIEAWLASHGQLSPQDADTRDSILLRKHKRRIASIAKYLFGLFWPADFEHPITDKYWGAVYQILTRENEFFANGQRDPRSDLADASAMYHILHDDILPIAMTLVREFLSYEDDLRPLPDAFSKTWLHVITAFVLTADTTPMKRQSFSYTGISKHLFASREEISKGKKEITTRLRKIDLETLEVCDFNSLITMVINRLARDNMGNNRPHVAEVYGNYYYALEDAVYNDPVPRKHQETIRFFVQEVEAILATLQDQMSIIEGIQTNLQQSSEISDPIFEDALGESRQLRVIDSCKAWIGGRIDKFKGLQQRAIALDEWHRTEMDTNKDRQEKAILIFTIVTIIFLPLSFVASIMGMNTHDIRDMPYGQWIYWAAGIPLTVIVVLASLWFAGELENFGAWLTRKESRRSQAGRRYGYEYEAGHKRYDELTTIRPMGRAGFRGREREGDVEDTYLPTRLRRSTSRYKARY